MNKELYEKYGKYFLNKFQNNKKLKFDIVCNNENGFGVYIYSNSDFSEYFLRIDDEMIYIDGIIVQDEGLEFKNIAEIDESIIYKYLDEQASILQTYLDRGINLYAFIKDGNIIRMSTDKILNENLLNTFNAENFYNQCCFAEHPKFEDIIKLQLQNFYGDVIYEYTSQKNKEKD